MFGLIDPSFYSSFFLILIGVLAVFHAIKLYGTNNTALLVKPSYKEGIIGGFILSMFLVVFFGTRDPYSLCFDDTYGYSKTYEIMREWDIRDTLLQLMSKNGKEILWIGIGLLFSHNGFSVNEWYLLIASLYILFIFFAVKRLFPRNTYLAVLFAFLNFGFYSGGINGIRNWTALSIVLYAMTCLNAERWDILDFLRAVFLMTVAYFIHSSTIIPSLCILSCYLFCKNPSILFKLWFVVIPVSFVFGNAVSQYFVDLGFDDRVSYLYTGTTEDAAGPVARFRWDFLLFSSVPVLWGNWIIKQAALRDKTYNLIYNSPVGRINFLKYL